ncbi:hypothetical protein PSPO01_09786 [Paraphaeosphaeria sporulosa]
MLIPQFPRCQSSQPESLLHVRQPPSANLLDPRSGILFPAGSSVTHTPP